MSSIFITACMLALIYRPPYPQYSFIIIMLCSKLLCERAPRSTFHFILYFLFIIYYFFLFILNWRSIVDDVKFFFLFWCNGYDAPRSTWLRCFCSCWSRELRQVVFFFFFFVVVLVFFFVFVYVVLVVPVQLLAFNNMEVLRMAGLNHWSHLKNL